MHNHQRKRGKWVAETTPKLLLIWSISFPGKFIVNVTSDRNCALYLNASLDYETEESYLLEIELVSLQGFINKEFSKTHVTINIADINDNAPIFVFPDERMQKFYAAVPKGASLSTTVTQIKVSSSPSSHNALISIRFHRPKIGIAENSAKSNTSYPVTIPKNTTKLMLVPV